MGLSIKLQRKIKVKREKKKRWCRWEPPIWSPLASDWEVRFIHSFISYLIFPTGLLWHILLVLFKGDNFCTYILNEILGFLGRYSRLRSFIQTFVRKLIYDMTPLFDLNHNILNEDFLFIFFWYVFNSFFFLFSKSV